jgi:hypothetical protein
VTANSFRIWKICQKEANGDPEGSNKYFRPAGNRVVFESQAQFHDSNRFPLTCFTRDFSKMKMRERNPKTSSVFTNNIIASVLHKIFLTIP